MRLGGKVFVEEMNPDNWTNALQAAGFRATAFPLDREESMDVIQAYVKSAASKDIVISEVGAWSNPISRDDVEAKKAVAYCSSRLALADEIGSACCVNIAGSRGVKWDGPDGDNFSDDTFSLIVDTVRAIIDAVKPKRTVYALEMMPWIFPDSASAYLSLLKAIDRPGFGVHFDPVNIVCSPRIYYRNGDMIRDFIRKLGPHIRNCHAKDVLLQDRLTTHFDEVIPGQGMLDYDVFLTELNKLHPDVPLIIEHLHSNADYAQAAGYIRSVAARNGIDL